MADTLTAGAPAPVLAVVNGVPTTTSTYVAEYFGKRHDNVLRDIRELIALDAGCLLNFEDTPIINPQNGQEYPEFRITEEGFMLLAMGFTGKKALGYKLAFIAEFKRLRAALGQRALPAPAAPEIDVAALLLSGQSDPVPLTPTQYRLVDQRAYALSAEAHALIREHLLRAVAFHTTRYAREEAGNTALVQLLDSITLGKALAHHHLNQTHAAVALLASAHDLIGQAHARLQADLKTAGQSAHARH